MTTQTDVGPTVAPAIEIEGARRGGWRPSISAILTFGFGFLVLAAVGAVLWVSLLAASENTFTLTRSKAELTLGSLIGRVQQHLGAARHQAEFVAGLIAEGSLGIGIDEELGDVLLGSLAAAPAISGIVYITPEGRAIRVGRKAGSFLKLDSDWSGREDIMAMVGRVREAGRITWLGVHWVDELNEPQVSLALPVTRDERYLGVVSAVISVRVLSTFLSDINRQYDIRSFILHGRDHVLAHPSLAGGFRGVSAADPMPTLGEVNDGILAKIWRPAVDRMPHLLADSPVAGHVVQDPAEDLIYLYREVSGFGPVPWIFGIHYRASEINTEFRRLMLAAGIGLGILLVSVVLSYLLGRAIARPIRRLADASLAIRDLDFRAVRRIGRSPFREIDEAAVAYNSMLNGLRWFETYVPRSLVFRLIRRGESEVPSEERQVTVLFTDIADFTSLSSCMEAADLAGFLNRHFALLAAAIEAEGGTVDKYIGDSVMAFWGAPGDQPDQAAEACRAALSAAEALAEDNAKRLDEGLAPIRLRIGIHSGPAVVGNIGAPGRINYTLIGDTVNSAQRLEGLGKEFPAAGADVTILISGDTRMHLGADFITEPLGNHRLRGRADETAVYRLEAGVPKAR
jgi:class 3 adenylate cyclase